MYLLYNLFNLDSLIYEDNLNSSSRIQWQWQLVSLSQKSMKKHFTQTPFSLKLNKFILVFFLYLFDWNVVFSRTALNGEMFCQLSNALRQ